MKVVATTYWQVAVAVSSLKPIQKEVTFSFSPKGRAIIANSF
jgi:hypothetical protein